MIGKGNKMNVLKKYPFQLFLFLHFVVWSFLPLMRRALPMDSIEAVSWGMYCTLGTNKHPPFSGWLANFFYNVIGFEHPLAIYVLSQICVLIGFIYIYRLARGFLSKDRAIFSVMLLEGVIYYGFSAIEFNVNVVSLALWPMCVFYFYKALKQDKLTDWFLTGLSAGLNLFDKYTCAFLFASMAFFTLYNENARQKLKTFKPYFAALVCGIVILPHLIWLYQNGFMPFEYFVERGGQSDFARFPLLGHIVYPLKFLGAQVLFGFGALLAYFYALRKEKKLQVKATSTQSDFLLILGLMPVLLMALVSFIGGTKLKSMWGFPCLYLTGVLFFTFLPCKLTDKFKKKMYVGIYALMFLFAVAQGLIIWFNKSDKFQLDAKAFGRTLEEIWYEKNGKMSFEYVAGDVWWANNAALFAPSKPKPVIWGDLKKNPWFDGNDVLEKGALILASGESEYNMYRKNLKFASPPKILEVIVYNRQGKAKVKKVYYGFYNLKGRR